MLRRSADFDNRALHDHTVAQKPCLARSNLCRCTTWADCSPGSISPASELLLRHQSHTLAQDMSSATGASCSHQGRAVLRSRPPQVPALLARGRQNRVEPVGHPRPPARDSAHRSAWNGYRFLYLNSPQRHTARQICDFVSNAAVFTVSCGSTCASGFSLKSRGC